MRTLSTLLLLSSLCILTSCGAHRYKEEPWTEKQWKQALAQNQDRLKSEEQRQKQTAFAFINKATTATTNFFAEIYHYITGETPFNAAKALLDPLNPDRRREGVVYLSKRDFGRQEPYVKYYAELARTDEDWSVQAMAIRALNRSRRRQVIDLYIRALDDERDAVRLESAKALANMPDPSAVPSLIEHLQERAKVRISFTDRFESRDENPDVRLACADALRNFNTIEVSQALVRVLRDRSFAVSYQARESLKLITGKDYRYDQSAWLEYLSTRPSGV